MEESHEKLVQQYKLLIPEIEAWAEALHKSQNVLEKKSALLELRFHHSLMHDPVINSYRKADLQQHLKEVNDILQKHPRTKFKKRTNLLPTDVMCDAIKDILFLNKQQIEPFKRRANDDWNSAGDRYQRNATWDEISPADQPNYQYNNEYFTPQYVQQQQQQQQQQQPPNDLASVFVEGDYNGYGSPFKQKQEGSLQQRPGQNFPQYGNTATFQLVQQPQYLHVHNTNIQNIIVSGQSPATTTPPIHPDHNQFNDGHHSYELPKKQHQHRNNDKKPQKHQESRHQTAQRIASKREETEREKPKSSNVTGRPYSSNKNPNPFSNSGVKSRILQEAGKVFPLGPSEEKKSNKPFDLAEAEDKQQKFTEKLEEHQKEIQDLRKQIEGKEEELVRKTKSFDDLENTHKATMADLEKAKKEQLKKTKELEDMKNAHDAEILSLKKVIEGKNKSVSELEDQLKEGKARFDLMKNETAPLITLRDELAALLGTDTNDMESIKDQVKLLKTDLERAQNDQHAKTTELEALKNDHVAKVESLTKDIEEKNKSVRELESQLKDETAPLITLRDEMAALLDTDTNDMESIKDQVKLLKTENEKNGTLLTELEEEKSKRAEENRTLTALQNTKKKLQIQINELENNLKQVKAALNEEKDQLQGRVNSLETENKNQAAMLTQLESQLKEEKEKLNGEKGQLAALQQEYNEQNNLREQVESKVREHQKTIKELETNMEKEKAERTAAKADLAALQKKFEEEITLRKGVESEHQNKIAELETSLEKEKGHKKDTESLRAEVEKLKVENRDQAALLTTLEQEKAALSAENGRLEIETTRQNEEEKKLKAMVDARDEENRKLNTQVANLEENGRIPAEHVSSQEVQELRTKLAETKEKYKKKKEDMRQQVSHSRTMDNDRLRDKDYLRYFFESSVISQPDEVNGMLMRASIEAISRLNPTPIAPSPRAGTSQMRLVPIIDDDSHHSPKPKKRKVDQPMPQLEKKLQIIDLKDDEESKKTNKEQKRREEKPTRVRKVPAHNPKLQCKYCGKQFAQKEGKSRHELHHCPKNEHRTPSKKKNNKSTENKTTQKNKKETVVADAASSTPQTSTAPSSSSTASKSTAGPSISTATTTTETEDSD